MNGDNGDGRQAGLETLSRESNPTYDGLQNTEESKKRLDYLIKERQRWRDNGHKDTATSIKEELEEEKEQYASTIESILLENKGPVARFLTRLGYKSGVITSQTEALKEKKSLEQESRNYRRLDNRIRKEMKSVAKEIDILEGRLGQTYEFDIRSENVIQSEAEKIYKLKNEIAEIRKGNYDAKDPKRLMEAKNAEIRATEEYIRDMERKRMDNFFDERYLRASLEESKDWYSSLEIESKEILEELYGAKEKILPIRSATNMAERKKSSLDIRNRTQTMGDRAKRLAETMKEHNYRVEAITLGRTNASYDDDSSSAVTDAQNDAKVRRDNIVKSFQQNQNERLAAMRLRRNQYFEGTI